MHSLEVLLCKSYGKRQDPPISKQCSPYLHDVEKRRCVVVVHAHSPALYCRQCRCCPLNETANGDVVVERVYP